LILCIIILVSNPLISVLIFIVSFCILILGLTCSYFSSRLRLIIRLFEIWFFDGVHSYKLSSMTAFTMSQTFWYLVFSFSFDSRIFWLSLYFFNESLIIQKCIAHSPFACLLSVVFLILISRFSLLWANKIQEVISVFLYLLRLALCNKYDLFWRKVHGLLRRSQFCGCWVECSTGVY
jgi:hypothetical protein